MNVPNLGARQIDRVIVVYADGLMGKRVVRILQEELRPEQIVALAPLEGDEVAELDAVGARPGDVVVNAAGLHPFQHDPRPIIDHCLASGAHYIDLCESVDLHERGALTVAEHERTNTIVSAVIQGCSTVPAMVDVLMPARPQGERTVLLSVGMRNELSASLMYGLLRPLGQQHRRRRCWHRTTTRTLFGGARRRYGSHPGPWSSERTHFFCGLDQPITYWALLAVSLATRLMSDRTLFRLCQFLLPVAGPLGRLGTPDGSLRLEHRTDNSRISSSLNAVIEIRAATNGLDIPALPACWAALALLGRTEVNGLITLGELMDRSAIIHHLKQRGYEVDRLEAEREARPASIQRTAAKLPRDSDQ